MKQNHQTFIIEMIKHGDKVLAYQKAYPKCTDEHSARKSAERLLRHHPEIAAEIEEAAANIRQRAYAEAYHLHTEQRKVKLLSMMDRREILARIAKCEIKVCRYVKDGNGYRMLFEDPHPREIIRAVEADTRIEDMCNRARNLADPKLSQFNIYIDGRPCDDPTAPINHELPPGIFMLPRTRKKLTVEQGIISEQVASQHLPLQGAGGQNSGIKTEQTASQYLPLQGAGGQNSGIKTEQTASQHLPLQGGGGQNSGINLEQNIETGSFPVFREGGTNEVSDGRVDSRGILAQEKTPAEQGIKTERFHTEDTHHTSPLPGDLGVSLTQEQSTESPTSLRLSDSAVQPSDTSHYTSPLSGVLLALENSPLYPQYLALYEKRKLQAEDLLSASFYAQDQRAIASAPPPKILTPEEVRELHEEADRKREEKKKQPQPQYNTFGKMYFPPERS